MPIKSVQEFLAASVQKDLSGDVFELESSHLLEVKLNGRVWAKSGSMVAYQGAVKFVRQGMMEQGLGNLLKKALSGEGMQLMKIEGAGGRVLGRCGQEDHPAAFGRARRSSSTATMCWRTEDRASKVQDHDDEAQSGGHAVRGPVQRAPERATVLSPSLLTTSR